MKSGRDCPNIFGIKVMIFDFDGVIIDSMKVKVSEYRRLYSQFTKDESLLNEIAVIYENSIGLPREATFKKVFKDILKKSISDQEIERFSKEYSQAIFSRLNNVNPVNGFLEYLDTHKKLSKYVLSGAPHSDLTYLMDKLRLSEHFKSFKGGPLEKKEEIINIKVQENVESKEIVYFGDQKNDYIAAKTTGVQFIGINASRGLEKMQCKIFSNFQELIAHERTRDSLYS